jgi:SET domain-containing protein
MQAKLYIGDSLIPNAGRGVFAGVDFKKGDLIEECVVIVLSEKSLPFIDKTELERYYFVWGDDEAKGAIALGFGSLYNHSYESNAMFEQDFKNGVVRITAYTDIDKGTEITFNYNGDPTDKTPLWENALSS